MTKITLKGQAMHTNSSLPSIGSQAPDFILVDATLKEWRLKDFEGKKKIFSIVPSLDTPTCSTSARKFNELAKNHDWTVLCISTDLPFAQKRICDSLHLTTIIPLSTVRSKQFAQDYGVLIEDGPLQGMTARAIIVLDEKGKVLYTQIVPEISEEPDYNAVTQLLG